MYHAKSLGRNSYHFFNEGMELNAEKNIRLIADLRSAINKNQFELFYQPKINLSDGSIIGAEALIRWRHPEQGLIFPLDFIPVAESSGIIFDIGEWVIQQACRDCKSWSDLGLAGLGVAINVSAMQFKRGNIASVIHEALIKSELPAASLELELTESTLIDDSKTFRAVLSSLRSYGVQFSIDDFGTGYSNLGYLKKMEVGILKIDQSFVRRLLEDTQDKAIVLAVIQIAKSLNLKTIAEGVEQEELIAVLREMGCDYGQGYYWSRPVPNDEFVQYVRQQRASNQT
ncbi:bifunctional diguanylate cyclase/phosphodiesterase [Oceanicoccus sp. KOV_DT_Chl]|uniref:putative bifunctional diguanylate cyclase/phosphodiesterase n=1 Tax=Oceanicoccus sp. KOV_DT_Chl TaxID=1904639 RepID=UPI000C7E322B|nr:EAL domain-containing protein [Oceanicoccus sp. KOV_DT_Chl]